MAPEAKKEAPRGFVPEPELPPYQPLKLRRRFQIVGLALAMAALVMWLVLERPGAPPLPKPVKGNVGAAATTSAEPPPCRGGQSSNCIGGKVELIAPVTPVAPVAPVTSVAPVPPVSPAAPASPAAR
jgi:hypothetical protein